MHVSISVDVMPQDLAFPLCAHLTLRLKLASARAAPGAAAAGGVGTKAGNCSEQSAMEGEHLAADEPLQAAAQQQQAVSCFHPVFVLSAIEARRQL